jgi:hypothetical protein
VTRTFDGSFPLYHATVDRRRIVGLTWAPSPFPAMVLEERLAGHEGAVVAGAVRRCDVSATLWGSFIVVTGTLYDAAAVDETGDWYLGPDLHIEHTSHITQPVDEWRMTGQLVAVTLQRDPVWAPTPWWPIDQARVTFGDES